MSFVRVFIPERAVWVHDAFQEIISEFMNFESKKYHDVGDQNVVGMTLTESHKEQCLSALRYALYSGRITARYMNDEGEASIRPSAWRKEYADLIIQFGVYIEGGNKSNYESDIKSIIERGEWVYIYRDEFDKLIKEWDILTPNGVEIVMAEVSEHNTIENLRSHSKIGRPTKFDWIRLAGYLCGYIVENDPKSEASVVKVALQWFDDNPNGALSKPGTTPHKRDLEDFVAELFKTMRRKT